MIYLCVDQKLEVRRTRLFCNFIKLYLQTNWHGNRLIVSLAILSTFYARPDNSTVRKVNEYINGMENKAHLPYALHSSILYISSRRPHYFSIADVTVAITNIPYKCYLVIYDHQIYFFERLFCFTYSFRVGWSVMDSDLSLGEDKLSYGFGGTGRAATNKKFKLYGEAYGPGDYISCFIVSQPNSAYVYRLSISILMILFDGF